MTLLIFSQIGCKPQMDSFSPKHYRHVTPLPRTPVIPRGRSAATPRKKELSGFCPPQARIQNLSSSQSTSSIPGGGSRFFRRIFLLGSAGLGWARARDLRRMGTEEQLGEKVQIPPGWAGLGTARLVRLGGRKPRLSPSADGLPCQESSVRRAHQKALTSLN